jgi:hypothetical protein
LLTLAQSILPEMSANKRLYIDLYSRHLPAIRKVPPIMSRLPFTVPARLHYAGRVVRRARELLGEKVIALSRGRIVPRAMEATQWNRWLALDEAFRSAYANFLTGSSVVDSARLDATLERLKSYSQRVSGTRIMLTASHAAYWR